MYEQLLADNRGLLYYAARKYATACQLDRAVDFDDLLQAGFIGLVHAHETYDADKGSWSSWALLYIRNEILDVLGFTGARKAHIGAISLDEPAAEDSSETRLDGLADGSLMPIDDAVAEDDARRLVREAVADMKDDQQREVVQRWRLNGETARQIAQTMGIPQARVVSIWNAARKRLARDRRIREASMLDDMTPYYAHVGITRFNATWTSATELAALWRINHERSIPSGKRTESATLHQRPEP